MRKVNMISVFGASVAITAGTVVATKAGFIPESMCFLAITVTFFAGMGIAGKLLLMSPGRADGEN